MVDTVRSLVTPTTEGDWYSVAVCSQGEYDIEPGLITSYPVRNVGGRAQVVAGVPINDFARTRIDATVKELMEERELVRELL